MIEIAWQAFPSGQCYKKYFQRNETVHFEKRKQVLEYQILLLLRGNLWSNV
jgi:hypothetical protein